MVLGMDTRFSKTIANKFSLTSGGLFAQNPIWLPPEEVNAKLQLLILQEYNATYPMFSSASNPNMKSLVCFTAIFRVKGHFTRSFKLK